MAWLSGWSKRVKLTTDAGDITAALSNFPILLYISASSGRNSDDISCVFDELTADANRKKIAVTTSDGETQCYVEIEQWDDANEKAWLWVKAPSISSSADTDFYLYYDSSHADNTDYVGDPNSTPAQNVWDSNFKLVQHMNDHEDFVKVDSFSVATYEFQGVTTDGTYIWVTYRGLTYNGLSKYNMAGVLQTQDHTVLAKGSGANRRNFDDLCVHGDYLYVAMYNDTTSPKEGFIRRYDKTTFAYDSTWGEKDGTDDGDAWRIMESLDRHDYQGTERWWTLDCSYLWDYDQIQVWNDDFSTKYATFTLANEYSASLAGRQGIVWWDTDHILVTQHQQQAKGRYFPIDKFYFTGSAFTLVERYAYGNAGFGQGLTKTGSQLIANWKVDEYEVWTAELASTSAIGGSTSYMTPGWKKAAAEPVEADGKIGKGQNFDGSDDYILVDDVLDLALADDITLEVVLNVDTLDAVDQHIFNKGYVTGSELHFYVYLRKNTGTYTNQIGFVLPLTASTFKHVGSTTEVTATQDLYLTAVKDGATGKLYFNGAVETLAYDEDGSDDMVDDVSAWVGNYPTGIRPLDGIISELRVSDIARSAAWIKATYETCWDGLLDWGSEEEAGVTVTPSPASAIAQVVAPTVIPQLYESYNTGDDSAFQIYGTKWRAQTFTPSDGHTITSIKLKMYREGSPGTVTVSIRATSNGKPTGGDLCSGTTDGDTLTQDPGGEWRVITLGNGYNLAESAVYAIVVRAPNGSLDNEVKVRIDYTSPTYSGGLTVRSTDSGSTWYIFETYDFMFEEWGEPIEGVLVSPSAISAIASVIAPTVVKGSISLTPSYIAAIAQVAQPTVKTGNVIILPAAVDAIAEGVNPTVVHGSLTLAPDFAVSIADRVNPTVILGSTTATPEYVKSICAVIPPTVIAVGLNIMPDPASALGGAIAPTVVYGSLVITPDEIYAVAQVVAPTVKHGNILLSPEYVKAIAKAINPTIGGGGIIIEPEYVRAIARGENPEVILGSTTVTPEFVRALAGVIAPSIFEGNIGRKLRVVVLTSQYRNLNLVTSQKRKIKTVLSGG